MKVPSITVLKRYLTAMNRKNYRYMTCERLAHIVGVYPEVIAGHLSYFEPMLKMHPSSDLLLLIPQIKQHIQDEEEKKVAGPPRVVATKKDLLEYDSVADFVYKTMTHAGLIDRNTVLSEKELRILKRLVTAEIAAIRKKK